MADLITKLAFLSLTALALEAKGNTSFSGYSKFNFESYVLDKNKPEDNPHRVSLANRLSVVKTWDHLSFEGSYQFIPYYQHPPVSGETEIKVPQNKEQGYRIDDINQRPWRKDRNALHQNIDRAFFTYAPDNFTLTAGRQPLAFGSSTFINPTDVFAPFSPLAIDREERSGIDALRLRWFAGNSEIDIGVLFGSNAEEEHNAAYIKLNFNIRWKACGNMRGFF